MDNVYYVLYVCINGDYYEWEDQYPYPFHEKSLAEVKQLELDIQYKDVSGVQNVDFLIEECTAEELGDILTYNEYTQFMDLIK